MDIKWELIKQITKYIFKIVEEKKSGKAISQLNLHLHKVVIN
jgi:hypothetical protein